MVETPKEAVKGFWQESVLQEKLEDKFHHDSGIEATCTRTTISEEMDMRPIVLNEVESVRVEDEQNDWDEFFLDLSLWDVMSPNCGRIEGDTSQPVSSPFGSNSSFTLSLEITQVRLKTYFRTRARPYFFQNKIVVERTST
ncbi:hypothetical protein Nepgr_031666 [Nepenthes gracilis]|uniref:Uncharacterized protein n=1 Tax=Nepenthes gracilis TaxID=150966 RepID=A0AAD3TH62_NEPGR|nr:hypothetical protein Nepgr_031666 [Nepenthes gracilis]